MSVANDASPEAKTVLPSVLVIRYKKKNIILKGDPMKPVTLAGVHIKILENADSVKRDELIAGIIHISKGKEPPVSCFWKDVFDSLVKGHTPKGIPGIPQFDHKGMKESELDRYNKVQAGKIPSTGLNHRYKDLNFQPITTLPQEDLEKLYGECQNRINKRQGSAEYQRFIRYLADVIKYCADSGEL